MAAKLIKTEALPIATTEGIFYAHYSSHGLARLDFPNPQRGSKLTVSADVPAQVASWHETTKRAVTNVLSGKSAGKLPPLDWSEGTEFQQSIWKLLCHIEAGSVQTYGEIASKAGKSGAARAVGRACGSNPIPVLVPCHRVLAANRQLGGFSGGLDWKKKLLLREGVRV